MLQLEWEHKEHIYNLKKELRHTHTKFILGGQPSPNPSFPQNIKNVTGNNTISVANKNMLEKGLKFTSSSTAWIDNFGNPMANQYSIEHNSHYCDLKANTTYTFKINSYSNVNSWQLVYITENNTVGAIASKGTNVDDAKTFTPTTDMRVWFRFSPSSADVETYCYAQLELGDQATTYQERKTQTKPLNLTSKNLFNKDDVKLAYIDSGGVIRTTSTNYYVTNYILVEPSTTYVVSAETDASGNTPAYCFYDKNKTYISGTSHSNISLPYTITTPSNCYYIRDSLHKDNLNSYMLEKGSTPSTYVPYYNYELNKIGTYQDYIYKSGDKWYKKEVITKMQLPNDIGGYDGSQGTYYYFNLSTNLGISAILTNALMNYFKFYSSSDFLANTFPDGFTFNTAGTHVLIRNKSLTSQAQYRIWLENNAVKFYYIRNTAQDIQITDTDLIAQLEDIDKMQGYNGTTIITSTYDSSNAQMIINGSALKQTE